MKTSKNLLILFTLLLGLALSASPALLAAEDGEAGLGPVSDSEVNCGDVDGSLRSAGKDVGQQDSQQSNGVRVNDEAIDDNDNNG